MPVYVYRNLETGETFEVVQSMSEDALTTDPRTGAPVRRVIQPVGIAFKGSGFYVNDSRGSSGGRTAAGSALSKPDGGASASGSDSSPKPAAEKSGGSTGSAD